ncbi:MAG: hypothetical protein QW728_05350 [Thermoplasmata archaeon]
MLDPEEAESAKKRKERLAQLEAAEEKYRAMIERRNQLNAEAKVYADERNALNNERRKLQDQITQLIFQRDALNAEAKNLREQRNELQKIAKSRLGERKDKRKGVVKDLDTRIKELEAEYKMLERKYETSSVTGAEEKKMTEALRQKHKELEDLKKLASEQNIIKADLRGMDVEIDVYFAKANELHAAMLAKQKTAQEIHEQIVKYTEQVKYLRAESEKKHEAFLKTKEKANEVHNKAQELLETILVLRNESKAEREEIRKAITEQNEKVRQELFSEEKVARFEEEAINKLKTDGKFEL